MLVIVEGNNKGAAYKLGQRMLTIGRSPQNLIQIIDPMVSRRHASVRWNGESYVVTDLESKNGIYVNGKKVKEAVLSIGDELRLGDTVFELVEDRQDVEDSVLARRVAKGEEIEQSTMHIDVASIQGYAQGGPVDVDQVAQVREAGIALQANRYSAGPGSGKSPMDLVKEALAYVRKTLDADRCLAFRLVDGKRLKVVAHDFSSELTPGEARAQPLKLALGSALKSGSAEAARGQAEVFAAAAAPLTHGGDVVGFLYVDCMARNPRLFLEDDLQVLNLLAPAISAQVLAASEPQEH